MENREDLNIGEKVHYTAPFGKKQNGIIKSFSDDNSRAFVVYHCSGDWDNYQNYTGALTILDDLTIGWIAE